jgi:hypothetical protein
MAADADAEAARRTERAAAIEALSRYPADYPADDPRVRAALKVLRDTALPGPPPDPEGDPPW